MAGQPRIEYEGKRIGRLLKELKLREGDVSEDQEDGRAKNADCLAVEKADDGEQRTDQRAPVDGALHEREQRSAEDRRSERKQTGSVEKEAGRNSKVLVTTPFPFDSNSIGNRDNVKYGGDELGGNLRLIDYTSKSGAPSTFDPNQYESVATPGDFFVTGRANSGIAVTVGGTTASRQGPNDEYFYRELSVMNTGGAFLSSLDIVADPAGTPDTITREVLTPKASVNYIYDPDGNLEDDGYRTFVWDAENWLIKVETKSAEVPLGAPHYQVLFEYDYLGRRVRKIVSQKPTPAGSFVLVRDRKFVYDGWNLIVEFENDDELVGSYLWGLDLDGQSGGATFGQGAGGVGGLLAVTRHSGANAGTHFVSYDGNGNVTALVDSSSGNESATYEYDPFGNLIAMTGPFALENPFRFSTKYHDQETGLSYYGFRYYDPVTGRWLSRDPIAEEGGLNLYGFVQNDPINGIDLLGLIDVAGFDGSDPGRGGNASGNDFRLAAQSYGLPINARNFSDLVRKIEFASTRFPIDSVTIFDHGVQGSQEIGEGPGNGFPDPSDPRIDPSEIDLLRRLGNVMPKNGIVIFRGCEVGSCQLPIDPDKPDFLANRLQRTADAIGRPIVAFTGKCGFRAPFGVPTGIFISRGGMRIFFPSTIGPIAAPDNFPGDRTAIKIHAGERNPFAPSKPLGGVMVALM